MLKTLMTRITPENIGDTILVKNNVLCNNVLLRHKLSNSSSSKNNNSDIFCNKDTRNKYKQ